MSEYEYEVTFRGSQWTKTIVVYHEADTQDGKDSEASELVEAWARSVAQDKGLEELMNSDDEVSIVKTGELL